MHYGDSLGIKVDKRFFKLSLIVQVPCYVSKSATQNKGHCACEKGGRLKLADNCLNYRLFNTYLISSRYVWREQEEQGKGKLKTM